MKLNLFFAVALQCCFSFQHFKPKYIRSFHLSSISSQKSLRIDRILSNRGHGSRTEIMNLIKRRRVTVGSTVVASAGEKFSEDIEVLINGVPSLPVSD
jgi:RNA-binding protein YlmH